MKDKSIKIVVFVPRTHADIVREAMGEAGAGIIGSYSYCSFSLEGMGRFKPLEGANPSIGKAGNVEGVIEERIECICPRSKAKEVIAAVRRIHPYEEVAFDIYPLISETEL